MTAGPRRTARVLAWSRGSAVAARRTPARNLANAVIAVLALVVTAVLILTERAAWLLVVAGGLGIGHFVWFGVVGARDRRRDVVGDGPDGALR